jgi:hypothetical protein
MDGGRAVEVGTPLGLYDQESGIFRVRHVPLYFHHAIDIEPSHDGCHFGNMENQNMCDSSSITRQDIISSRGMQASPEEN